MAHNYTTRDGMFTVREPSWHGLETSVFEDYPSREVAQKIAHPWEPVTEQVYRRVPTIVAHLHTDSCEYPCELRDDLGVGYEPIQEFKAVVRSDDGFTLGVVSDTYEPVSNSEMWDIAEAIEGGDPSAVRYETGGSLLGGKKVWLLLRLAEPLLVKGDPNGSVIPYYALQNAHDGSGSFRGQSLMTRIVCDNTAQMADVEAQARGTEFVFHHTKNVRDRIEEAKAALAGWRESIVVWNRFADHMVDLPISANARELFVEQFIPAPPPHVSSERVMRNVEVAREELRGILNGPTCADIKHTGWGLVQASLEYAQHARRARTRETAFKRAYLDRSRITGDAITLAQEVSVYA